MLRLRKVSFGCTRILCRGVPLKFSAGLYFLKLDVGTCWRRRLYQKSHLNGTAILHHV